MELGKFIGVVDQFVTYWFAKILDETDLIIAKIFLQDNLY